MESAYRATESNSATPSPDNALSFLDLFGSSKQNAQERGSDKSTVQRMSDWVTGMIWGQEACAPNPVYEAALHIASELYIDRSKADYIRNQSYKNNCRIGNTEDAVRYADEVLKSAGDPYTRVYGPEQTRDFSQRISGDSKIKGIGIQFRQMRGAQSDSFIDFVYPNSPAEKAGLKPGDQIIAVDGRRTAGLAQDKVSEMLKGEAGKPVRLTIEREGKVLEITPVRGEVVIPPLVSKMVDNDTLYVRLFDFMNDKSDQELKKVIESNPNAKAIILDLRGNGGGRLDELYQTLSLFMQEGKVFEEKTREFSRFGMGTEESMSVSLTRDKVAVSHSNGQTEYFERNPNVAGNRPVVVLADRLSASAAELFIGAVQANGRATVVGENTFGKGVGQSIFNLNERALVGVTNTRYTTPDGRWAGDGAGNRIGLKPDIEVKLNSNSVMLTKSDTQFQKALEVIRAMRSGQPIVPPRGVAVPN